MDRLGVLSSAVAKSITAELLPPLNKLATEFLAAKSAGLGFFEMLYARSSSAGDSNGDKIKRANQELEKLTKARDAAMASNRLDGGSIDTSGMDSKISILQNQIAYYKKLQLNEALQGADANYGNEGRGKTSGSGKTDIVRTNTGEPKPKKAGGRTEIAQASAEATAFAKSMEQLANLSRDADAAQLDLTKSQKALYDLMTSAEWGNMPEAWRQTAVAQFEQAQAAELASKAMADGKKLVEDMRTPHEVLANEIDRLNKLLDSGAIDWETYSRAIFAAQDALDKTQEKAKDTSDEMSKFFESAAKNIQGTMADFLFDPFADGIDGMGKRFSQMIQRMIADAAAAQLAKNLFGTMGQAAAGGGAGSWGWVGQAATWAASFFADGGIMTSGGPVPLRKYAGGGIANSPQLAMFGEGAQPEAYVPLPDGRRIPVAMQGSNGMTINQTIYAGQGTDSAQVRRSAAAGARAVLGAMNGAQRYA